MSQGLFYENVRLYAMVETIGADRRRLLRYSITE